MFAQKGIMRVRVEDRLLDRCRMPIEEANDFFIQGVCATRVNTLYPADLAWLGAFDDRV